MSRLIKISQPKYTVVPDNIIRDKDLDLKSRGMLVTLLNLAEKPNWHFSERGLTALFDCEGRDSIRSALKKLEVLGYLRRTQARGVDGAMGKCDYFIATERLQEPEWLTAMFENKQQEDEMLETITQTTPWLDFPTTDKPTTVNPTRYSKRNKE